MLFIPIDHQNKIVSPTPITWFLIGITLFVSLQSFPYIFDDEQKFEALIAEQRKIAQKQEDQSIDQDEFYNN